MRIPFILTCLYLLFHVFLPFIQRVCTFCSTCLSLLFNVFVLLFNVSTFCSACLYLLFNVFRGGFKGGRTRRAPLKLEKIRFFLRKIVIFHTKYPQNFRASLRSARFFLSALPPNLKSWIRPWCLYLLFNVRIPFILTCLPILFSVFRVLGPLFNEFRVQSQGNLEG